jgi:hypothetical protein
VGYSHSQFSSSFSSPQQKQWYNDDSDVVIVPGAPSLQFSLDYRATSFHCCEHLTTISRGPIDQFLSPPTSLGRPFKVVARSIPAPIGTGITRLSKDSANHSKSATATTTNFHSEISEQIFFSINMLALQGLKGGKAFCCI